MPEYQGNGRKRLQDMMNDLSHQQVLDCVILAMREHLTEEHGMNSEEAEDIAFERVADIVAVTAQLAPFEGKTLWRCGDGDGPDNKSEGTQDS